MSHGRLVVLLCLAVLSACGDDNDGGGPNPETPALLVERSHDPERVNDYLRLVFLPASVVPTRLGGPNAVRVFVAASTYFTPALALDEVASFLGVPDAVDQDLVGMRCQADDPAALDARLATWPHLFEIIRVDLGGQFTCPPPPGAPPENAVYCVAAAYDDKPETVISRALAAALEFGAGLLEDPATAESVRRRYGVYPAFSGLGLTVMGSADGHATTAADALQAAVSPEYLVHNATLADAGCRCIRVAPYAGRSMDPLDPAFIEQAGDLGSCRAVPKLRFAGS
jgi:hypothetical protein